LTSGCFRIVFDTLVYHAERILFATAKFLVHVIGKGRVRTRWNGRGGGREWGGKKEGQKMGMHEN